MRRLRCVVARRATACAHDALRCWPFYVSDRAQRRATHDHSSLCTLPACDNSPVIELQEGMYMCNNTDCADYSLTLLPSFCPSSVVHTRQHTAAPNRAGEGKKTQEQADKSTSYVPLEAESVHDTAPRSPRLLRFNDHGSGARPFIVSSVYPFAGSLWQWREVFCDTSRPTSLDPKQQVLSFTLRAVHDRAHCVTYSRPSESSKRDAEPDNLCIVPFLLLPWAGAHAPAHPVVNPLSVSVQSSRARACARWSGSPYDHPCDLKRHHDCVNSTEKGTNLDKKVEEHSRHRLRHSEQKPHWIRVPTALGHLLALTITDVDLLFWSKSAEDGGNAQQNNPNSNMGDTSLSDTALSSDVPRGNLQKRHFRHRADPGGNTCCNTHVSGWCAYDDDCTAHVLRSRTFMQQQQPPPPPPPPSRAVSLAKLKEWYVAQMHALGSSNNTRDRYGDDSRDRKNEDALPLSPQQTTRWKSDRPKVMNISTTVHETKNSMTSQCPAKKLQTARHLNRVRPYCAHSVLMGGIAEVALAADRIGSIIARGDMSVAAGCWSLLNDTRYANVQPALRTHAMHVEQEVLAAVNANRSTQRNKIYTV